MDEHKNGGDPISSDGASGTEKNSGSKYVFDWKSPDLDTPSRSAARKPGSYGRKKETGKTSLPVHEDTPEEKDILLFGDEEEEENEEKSESRTVRLHLNLKSDTVSGAAGKVRGMIASAVQTTKSFFTSLAEKLKSLIPEKKEEPSEDQRKSEEISEEEKKISGTETTEKSGTVFSWKPSTSVPSSAARQSVKSAAAGSQENAKTAHTVKKNSAEEEKHTTADRKTADRSEKSATSGLSAKKTVKKRKKKNKKRLVKAWAIRIAFVAAIVLIFVLLVSGIRALFGKLFGGPHNDGSYPEYVDEQLLTENPYSRPGIATGTIKSIVIHNTSETGTTAKEMRKYYESLATTQETRASVNFIVGSNGDVIVCVPDGELAYASNDRNMDSVSVEYCREDDGALTEEGYQALVNITAWLCKKYDLKASDVIRHYDVTGRNCPKYFVEDEDAWTQFRKDVSKAMKSL